MEPYEELEHKVGVWCGRPGNAVVCSSGTSALHLALETLRLKPGSKVLIPEFTMIACARAVTLAGLVPLPVDCGEDMLIRTDLLDYLCTPDTSAVMPVHVYGRRCAMDEIADFATRRGLSVIEDLAEAHGVDVHPKTDAACWSFYRNKIVAGEEGGAVAFRRPYHADTARQLRSLGFTKDHNFVHLPGGFNCRLSNANASLILPSLGNVKENLAARRQVESWYNQEIHPQWYTRKREEYDVCWVYDLILPEHMNPCEIVKSLNAAGVAARLSFVPISAQHEYQGQYAHLRAYEFSLRVIYLPVWPDMAQSDVRSVVESLTAIVSSSGSRLPPSPTTSRSIAPAGGG